MCGLQAFFSGFVAAAGTAARQADKSRTGDLFDRSRAKHGPAGRAGSKVRGASTKARARCEKRPLARMEDPASSSAAGLPEAEPPQRMLRVAEPEAASTPFVFARSTPLPARAVLQRFRQHCGWQVVKVWHAEIKTLP